MIHPSVIEWLKEKIVREQPSIQLPLYPVLPGPKETEAPEEGRGVVIIELWPED